MPKSTFFNLDKVKQQRLLKAGFQEFSRVPVYAASISNIIKLAKIPRGSFYQYFEDKFDFHAYLIQLYKKQWYQVWQQIVIDKKGDIFVASSQFFKEFLDKITSQKHAAFWNNVFITVNNDNFQAERKYLIKKHHNDQNELMIDFNLLRINISKSELLRQQLISFIIQAFHYYLINQKKDPNNAKQKACIYFDTLLDWLANGIKKGDKHND